MVQAHPVRVEAFAAETGNYEGIFQGFNDAMAWTR